jgi:multiple sugar transport system substrate-binding protein
MNRKSRMRRAVPAVVSALSAALVIAGCSGTTPQAGGGGTKLTIAGYKDSSHHIGEIIDTWNAAHPKAKARYVELPADSDAQHQQLTQNFLARSSTYDVVIGDDTWTSEFASKKWLSALPKDQFPASPRFAASVESGTYDNNLYFVPYTASADLFYYRSDLVPKPPTTWAQLIADCGIARAKHMGCYSGQYAQYEGLTINFLSAVASAGGAVLSPDGQQVLVNSPQAAQGLNFLVNGFKQGYIPKEAITFKEDEARRAFQQGHLLFMMNYSYAYEQANTPGPDSKVAGHVGLASLPGLNGPGVTATGGHMMGVSSFSKHRSDAEQFVKFFTSEANARQLLIRQSYTPVWKNLYDDPTLTKQFPFLPVIDNALTSAVVRPKTKNYVALSLVIQKNVYAALQGSKSTADALKDMAKQLQDVIAGR